MQSLTCRDCGTTWEREPKRGRPPVKCPDCAAGKPPVPQKKPKPKSAPKTPDKAQEFSEAKPRPRRKAKTAYSQMHTGIDHGPLDDLPFASRTSGWCTDYDPSPVAVHDRCDGDLGKYRCPCDCHGWKDAA